MLRAVYLSLTDRRIKAVRAALRACASLAGDLAAAPEGAPAALRPLMKELEEAAREGVPASGPAAAAALDLLLRLEKFFSCLALHRTPPDARTRQALALLQRACSRAPRLLSLGRKAALEEIRAACASARALLQAAAAEAEEAPAGFPEKLKFCSIYSDLGGIFSALERCAEALYGR